MPKKEDPAGHLKKFAWKPGESGNPNGRPLGSKNKLKLTKEAFEEVAGISPGEMLAMIAQRQFAQSTAAGDAMAIKAITEANKYIEPTQDAKTAAEEKVEELSEDELLARILELTDEALDESKH
jgi:DNA polymerase III delta prime subunit|tara:strand:+ start:223 stop:594 length:372 start_codon:yes stop_codon:yes gene_type:complete